MKRIECQWDGYRLQRWYITIPSSDQWCATIENHRYQWLSYPKTIGKPLIPMVQRWANSVLMTEYEYEYYSASQKLPNTNTNIIRLSKKDRIRIRILFGFPKMTEYEYYSDPQKYIAETSQTNANSVSMQSCMHTIQVNIWIHTVRKIFTNTNNVILHFWSKKF